MRLGCWPMLIALALLPLLWLSNQQDMGPSALVQGTSAAADRATSLAELALAEGPAERVGESAVPGPRGVPVPLLAAAAPTSKFMTTIPRTPAEQSKSKDLF